LRALGYENEEILEMFFENNVINIKKVYSFKTLVLS